MYRHRVQRSKRAPITIGWREWLLLPEFTDIPLKAKVDTGARTSALHAFGLHIDEADGVTIARFELHPHQRSGTDPVTVESPVQSFRKVKSSNGKVERRPVIRTMASVGDLAWPIDITLTRRDAMGFRLLLGRAAIRRRFVVDPGRSFVTGTSVPKGDIK